MKRYQTTRTMPRWDGKKVYRTTYYPIIQSQESDAIIISNETNYLDSLAYTYYNDPTLWWVIALANNLGKGRMSVPAGIQLRIPTNINAILVQYANMNQQ